MKGFELEHVNCPICASSKHQLYLENIQELYNQMDDYFNLVKCLNCNFIFTNPRPTEETIGYFYPDSASYFNPLVDSLHRDTSILLGDSNRKILESLFGYNFKGANYHKSGIYLPHFLYSKFYLQHIPYYKRDGKLLDIGCSWGRYMHLMKNLDWNVYGLEPKNAAVEFATNNLGLNQIKLGFLTDGLFEKDFFDVVHASMVLEHVHRPLEFLRNVNTILKAGGQLILSVPNIEGMEVKLHKKYAYTLHVPAHLNHFDLRSIRRVLSEAKFEIDVVVFQRVDRDLISPFAYRNRSLFVFLKNKIIRRTFVKPLVYLLSLMGKTSRMTIYATNACST